MIVIKQKQDISGLFKSLSQNSGKYKFALVNKADKKTLKVKKKGTAKGRGAGTAAVALYFKKGGSWTKTEERTITVEKPDIKKGTTQLKAGDIIEGATLITGTEKAVPDSWESNRSDVAAVEATTGRIQARGKGKAVITVKYGSGKGAAKYRIRIKVG